MDPADTKQDPRPMWGEHPEEIHLQFYAARAPLGPEVIAKIEEHLAACSGCKSRVDLMRIV